MAIAAFRSRIFDTVQDLNEYVTTQAVTTIISIVCDSSGKYVLFYI